MCNNVGLPAYRTSQDGANLLTATALYRAVLLAFALLVLTLVFPLLAGLLLLTLLTVVLAIPLSATTDRLERLHIPRAVGAPLLLLAGLGLLAGLIALLVPVFVSEGNRLVNSLPSIVHDVRSQLGHVTHTSPDSVGQNLQKYVNGYTSHPQKLLGPATTIGAGLAGVLTTLIVVLLTALYTAVHPRPLVSGAVRLVPPAHRPHARHIMRRLAQTYVGWLRGLGVGMAVLGLLTYIGLRLVGLPFALVFATLTAVAMVIPYFGALISAIPPIVLALTISPGKALIVAGIYIVTHQIEGNILQPLVMARAAELHPALIAVGVIAVERLFGLLGLMVSVPILVTFKILVEELWVRSIESAHGDRDPPDGVGATSEDAGGLAGAGAEASPRPPR
jgi:predicted PurR-regulated permease PerM